VTDTFGEQIAGKRMVAVERPTAEGLREWVHANARPRGKPWSFERYEYLEEPLLWCGEWEAIRASTQVGKSTAVELQMLYVAAPGNRVGYYLPTKVDVRDHVQNHVDPLIDDSESLTKLAVGWQEVKQEIRRRKQRPDNVLLLKFGNGWIHYRGLQDMKEAKRTPMDMVIVDEASEIAHITDAETGVQHRDMLIGRMEASELQWWRETSQTELEDEGIDATYKEGSQASYRCRCRRCRTWVDLGMTWPECVMGRHGDGRLVSGAELERGVAWPDCEEWFYTCPRCRNASGPARITLPRMGDNEWAWQHDKPTLRESKPSYWICGLYGPQMTPEKAARRWHGAQKDDESLCVFYWITLGRPRNGRRKPLTEERLRFGDFRWYPKPIPGQPVAVGIDIGDLFHCVANMYHPDLGWILANVLETDEEEEAERWMRVWEGPTIIDARPEKHTAVRLARRVGGRHVAVLYTHDGQRGNIEEGDFKGIRTVSMSREWVIDEGVHFIESDLLLPPKRWKNVPTVCQHFTSFKRQKTDKGLFRWAHVDHYGMAECHAKVAIDHGTELRLVKPKPMTDPKDYAAGEKMSVTEW